MLLKTNLKKSFQLVNNYACKCWGHILRVWHIEPFDQPWIDYDLLVRPEPSIHRSDMS